LASRKTNRKLPPPTRRRAIRVRAGATLDEVGDLVGVSGEAVRLWETGQRIPSESHRDNYIDVLDDLRTR
jgi:transcriptional regulator with XRE-family HTH domain